LGGVLKKLKPCLSIRLANFVILTPAKPLQNNNTENLKVKHNDKEL